MLLCVDIGNTNIVLGLYAGGRQVSHYRMRTVHEATADEYGSAICSMLERAQVAAADLDGVALCSVVPRLSQTFDEVARTYLGRDVLHVDASLDLGLRIAVDRPQEVGADRLVNSVAAYHLLGGPTCVVDFGTATKFDVVSADGVFLGGAIAPGLGIASEALFSRASKLYRVTLTHPGRVIGRNTVEAMQAGTFVGYLCLVEGMVDRIRNEVGAPMNVLATGGLAPLVAPHVDRIQRVEPWLTLEGLRLIWERCRPA
ncbi:MAG: type III pantothenate kinase [Caldilineales bacterium]|nr:type III pantothenate kinase [Caldilineales bacterium]